MQKKLNYLSKLTLALIIFLVPANFFYKFEESFAYVHNLKVDYLIPKIFLVDILIVFLVAIWLGQGKLGKKLSFKKLPPSAKITTFLFVIIFIRQVFSSHPIISLIYLSKISIFIIFFYLLNQKRQLFKSKGVEIAIYLSLFFQSLVAIYQYFNQSSLYGYLLLGEPNLNNYIGIAKTTTDGIEKIIPYGTTAHPNILAGFISIYLLFLFKKFNFKKIKGLSYFKNLFSKFNAKHLVITFALMTLFITNSLSGILVLFIGLIVIGYQKLSKNKVRLKLKPVFFITLTAIIMSIFSIKVAANVYPENKSLNRRSYLNSAAIKMIENNLITGVGINNFTSEVEKYSSKPEIVRFVQPAHNIFLLFFAETGLIGIAIVSLIIFSSFNKLKNRDFSWIIILLPIALLDHYLITINSGLLLLFLSATNQNLD